MMRLKSSLTRLIQAGLLGNLPNEAQWLDQSGFGVVLASRGYPESSIKGDIIIGLDAQTNRLKIFHAGTKQSGDAIVTDGGRVLCVTALADDIQTAQKMPWLPLSVFILMACNIAVISAGVPSNADLINKKMV